MTTWAAAKWVHGCSQLRSFVMRCEPGWSPRPMGRGLENRWPMAICGLVQTAPAALPCLTGHHHLSSCSTLEVLSSLIHWIKHRQQPLTQKIIQRNSTHHYKWIVFIVLRDNNWGELITTLLLDDQLTTDDGQLKSKLSGFWLQQLQHQQYGVLQLKLTVGSSSCK